MPHSRPKSWARSFSDAQISTRENSESFFWPRSHKKVSKERRARNNASHLGGLIITKHEKTVILKNVSLKGCHQSEKVVPKKVSENWNIPHVINSLISRAMKTPLLSDNNWNGRYLFQDHLHVKMAKARLLILIFCLALCLSEAVRPIRPDKRGKFSKKHHHRLKKFQEDESSNEINQSVSCPKRCVCYNSTVRCMFLKLKEVPSVLSSTQVL